MRKVVSEATTPPIKALIQENYVPWDCNIDTLSEAYVYRPSLRTVVLPLICIIDPADPSHYLDRTFGLQGHQAYYDRLLAKASSHCRVTIANLKGAYNGLFYPADP